MSAEKRKFYVSIFFHDGEIQGHAYHDALPSPEANNEGAKSPADDPQDMPEPVRGDSFETVFDGFVSDIETYRRFIPFTLDLAPQIARVMAQREIAQFAKENGSLHSNLSNENTQIYEFDAKLLRDFWQRQEKVISASEGARLLPSVW